MTSNKQRFITLVQTHALQIEQEQPEGRAGDCVAWSMMCLFENHCSRDRLFCPLYINDLAKQFVN